MWTNNPASVLNPTGTASINHNAMYAANKIVTFVDRSIPENRSNAYKVAYAAAKTKNTVEYMNQLIEIIAKISSVEGTAQVGDFLKKLIQADIDKQFNIILQQRNLVNQFSGIIGSPPQPEVNDYNRLHRLVLRYTELAEQGKLLSMSELRSEMVRYLAAGTEFLGVNGLAKGLNYTKKYFPDLPNFSIPNTFGCCIGGYPLAHVQEIELARSGKVLKFRATGSIFLATQKGSTDALRIEILILPNELVFTLMTLWVLFLYGRCDVKEIEDLNLTQINIQQLRGKLSEVTSYNKQLQKPSYEFHRTFPFVSRHVIIPNIFIETLSFEDKIVNGFNVVSCSILCRTYRKPRGFQLHKTSDPSNTLIAYNPNTRIAMYRMLEFAANVLWRYIVSNSLIFDERSWKTGVESTGQDDVYYNVEPEDIAMSFALGLFGMSYI